MEPASCRRWSRWRARRPARARRARGAARRSPMRATFAAGRFTGLDAVARTGRPRSRDSNAPSKLAFAAAAVTTLCPGRFSRSWRASSCVRPRDGGARRGCVQQRLKRPRCVFSQLGHGRAHERCRACAVGGNGSAAASRNPRSSLCVKCSCAALLFRPARCRRRAAPRLRMFSRTAGTSALAGERRSPRRASLTLIASGSLDVPVRRTKPAARRPPRAAPPAACRTPNAGSRRATFERRGDEQQRSSSGGAGGTGAGDEHLHEVRTTWTVRRRGHRRSRPSARRADPRPG